MVNDKLKGRFCPFMNDICVENMETNGNVTYENTCMFGKDGRCLLREFLELTVLEVQKNKVNIKRMCKKINENLKKLSENEQDDLKDQVYENNEFDDEELGIDPRLLKIDESKEYLG